MRPLAFKLEVMAGNLRYYPANEAAALLLRLTGGRCFGPADLELIMQLGFTLTVNGEPYGL